MTAVGCDSPYAAFWRAAASATRYRNGDDIEAIVVHMAEGGGTVEWIANPRSGNSSHYVIRYSGQIVQMVRERDSAHSIKPGDFVRTSDDSGYAWLGALVRYGWTLTRKLLGADYRDPNTQVIAFEVEGYAKVGPNPTQRESLRLLVADIRRRHAWGIPVLGHRDFQDWKACPGKLIHWEDFGGHGVVVRDTTSEPQEDLVGPNFVNSDHSIGTATVSKTDANIIGTADGAYVPVPVGFERNVSDIVSISSGRYAGQSAYVVKVPGAEASGLLLTALATFVPAPTLEQTLRDQIASLTGKVSALKAKVAAFAADFAND